MGSRSACEVGLCTVGVGKEGLAQCQKGSGFAVAVGIGTVLEGTGLGCGSLTDLYCDDRSQLGGEKTVEGEGVTARIGIGLRALEIKSLLLTCIVGVADLQPQCGNISGVSTCVNDELQRDLGIQLQSLADPSDDGRQQVEIRKESGEVVVKAAVELR